MDLIERQSAIDEIECELEMINSVLDSITLDFNARERLCQRRGEAREILNSIQQLPSAEPSIPISWIKKKIDCLASLDNAFASLAASNLGVMVKQYEEGCEFDADTEG